MEKNIHGHGFFREMLLFVSFVNLECDLEYCMALILLTITLTQLINSIIKYVAASWKLNCILITGPWLVLFYICVQLQKIH